MTTPDGWLSGDRERIRRFLGYQVGQLNQIDTQMGYLSGVSIDSVATCRALLTELQKIWEQLNSDRPYAATISHSNSGSSTDFMPGMKLQVSRQEGRRLARELAETLGLIVWRDVFASSGGGSQMVRS